MLITIQHDVTVGKEKTLNVIQQKLMFYLPIFPPKHMMSKVLPSQTISISDGHKFLENKFASLITLSSSALTPAPCKSKSWLRTLAAGGLSNLKAF